MTDINIVIQATEIFQKDYEKLDPSDQRIVDKAIDKAERYLSSGNFPNPNIKKLRGEILGYDIEVYMMKAPQKLRFFLTLENDPIFEQTSITLHRVFKRSNLDEVLRSIQESVRQEYFGEPKQEEALEEE